MLGSVVKKDMVRFGPRRQVGTAPADACQGQPAQALPEARIVEQDDRGATIEVVCACGGRTYLRCDYAAPKAPQPQRSEA